MPYRSFVLLIALALLGGYRSLSHAQTPAPADSLLEYDMDEIVISTPQSLPQEPFTMQRVALHQLERQNAMVVADIARSIPAAFVQTNSRGESLIYLRNAGERQVALFFNGALMNVPWDNRLNLDLIPAGMIGGMTVAKGVPSVLYGTNVLGGAINMTSRRPAADGHETTITGHYGSLDDARVGVGHLYGKGALNVGAYAGYASRNGIPVPDTDTLPFSQEDRRIRTNTDRDLLNLYAHADYRFRNGLQTGLSVLHIDGQFGVAPESHLDPATGNVRFWRYPEWDNTMAILNATWPIGMRTVVRGAFWTGRFQQTIDQFESVDYDRIVERQDDLDRTAGMRLTAVRSLGRHQLSLAFNGLASTHEEVVVEGDDNGVLAPAGPAPPMFRQAIASAGAEMALRLSDPLRLIVGGSLDAIATPETGDKPARDPLLDYGLNTGLNYTIDPTWTARISAGRKVRFPTMRELFGEALNRFLLNPDLRPETSFAAETALAAFAGDARGELVIFYSRVFDTIDQRNVDVDGRRLRQRINLEGSTVFGAEVAGVVALSERWNAEGHLAVMRSRGLADGGETRLTEKPDVLGMVNLEHHTLGGLSAMVQFEYTGRAYGRNEDNTLVALPRALAVDVRAGYRLGRALTALRSAEVYVRGDNLTNASVLPQLGLPAAGRTVSAGLTLVL